MKDFFSDLWAAAAALLGAAVFVGLMLWAARSHSAMWRRLAAHYAGRPRGAAIAARLETLVIAERGSGRLSGYRQYAGLRLALHPDGIAAGLIPIPPFNLDCKPLFLPFADMAVAETDWMLWESPVALRMKDAPDYDIIIGRDTLGWIRGHIDAPPFGLAP